MSLILQNNERFLPLCDAYQAVTGKRPTLSVPWRHSQYGIRGVFLEFVKSGGKRQTSIEAVRRFFEAQTQAAMPAKASSSQMTKQADAEIDRLTQTAKKGRKKKAVSAVA
jgi:hypothetical protein